MRPPLPSRRLTDLQRRVLAGRQTASLFVLVMSMVVLQGRAAQTSVVAQGPSTPAAETQPEALPEAPAAISPPSPEPALQREPPAPQPASVRNLPKKGRITFTLTYGGDRFGVGKVVQSWEVGPENYMLASDAETTGIVDLFRPQRLRYLSQGKITRQGLKPASFLVSRTRRGQTEAAEALFNWDTGSLTYGQARERTSAALPL